jgi:hypothetical protein
MANVNIWPIFWWFIVFSVSAFRLNVGLVMAASGIWVIWMFVVMVIQIRYFGRGRWKKWLWFMGGRQNLDCSPIFREGASDSERYKTGIRFLVGNHFDVTERPPVPNQSKAQKGSSIN